MTLHTKGVGEYDPTSRVQGRVRDEQNPRKKSTGTRAQTPTGLEFIHHGGEAQAQLALSCRKAKGLKDSQVLGWGSFLLGRRESLSFSSLPGLACQPQWDSISINLIDFVTLTGLNSGLRNSSFCMFVGC